MRRNYLADNLKLKAKELIEKRITGLGKKRNQESITYESDDMNNMFTRKVEGQVYILITFYSD